MTSTIHNNLKDFNPISLDEMNTISLLRRYDQKFTLNTSQFQEVFPLLAKDYYCLTIDNQQLFEYETEIVEVTSNANVAGELGPLKYLSGLTGKPMDQIINWLLLIIIFVFDPLAISLVVAANFAFAQAFPKKEEEGATLEEQAKYTDWEEEVKPEPFITEEELNEELFSRPDSDFPLQYTAEDEKRMDIIGQNGNDGEH